MRGHARSCEVVEGAERRDDGSMVDAAARASEWIATRQRRGAACTRMRTQKRIDLSADADRNSSPLGDIAMPVTRSVCPLKKRR